MTVAAAYSLGGGGEQRFDFIHGSFRSWLQDNDLAGSSPNRFRESCAIRVY
jgi:hypothetical protein